jgi:hypothetical protein
VQNPVSAVIYAGELAGAVVAIGAVARFVIVNPLKKWLREQIKPNLDAVHSEVTANHGSSLKDAVDRTETAVDELRVALRDHVEHHPGRRR